MVKEKKKGKKINKKSIAKNYFNQTELQNEIHT